MTMRNGRGPKFRRSKGKPITLKPKIVMKEIHGQVVPVKVYPAQYAKDISQNSRYHHRDLGDNANSQVTAKARSFAKFGDTNRKKRD
jgi:hypothetical protein